MPQATAGHGARSAGSRETRVRRRGAWRGSRGQPGDGAASPCDVGPSTPAGAESDAGPEARGVESRGGGPGTAQRVPATRVLPHQVLDAADGWGASDGWPGVCAPGAEPPAASRCAVPGPPRGERRGPARRRSPPSLGRKAAVDGMTGSADHAPRRSKSTITRRSVAAPRCSTPSSRMWCDTRRMACSSAGGAARKAATSAAPLPGRSRNWP